MSNCVNTKLLRSLRIIERRSLLRFSLEESYGRNFTLFISIKKRLLCIVFLCFIIIIIIIIITIIDFRSEILLFGVSCKEDRDTGCELK